MFTKFQEKFKKKILICEEIKIIFEERMCFVLIMILKLKFKLIFVFYRV